MQTFYYGQPNFLVLALVAGAWWFARRDRMWAAGVALAFATALKPQVMIMVPICLAVSLRLKPVIAWATGCVVLAAVFAAVLGSSGITSYWEALKAGQSNAGHTFFTVAYLWALHVTPATYVLLAVQGIACLFVAYRRRAELDVVFALGMLGSLLVSIHLHQPDYTNVVMAGWLMLRTSPALAHQLWLGLGIVTMQILTLGQPVPQLIWDAGWLVIIGTERRAAHTASQPVPAAVVAPTTPG